MTTIAMTAGEGYVGLRRIITKEKERIRKGKLYKLKKSTSLSPMSASSPNKGVVTPNPLHDDRHVHTPEKVVLYIPPGDVPGTGLPGGSSFPLKGSSLVSRQSQAERRPDRGGTDSPVISSRPSPERPGDTSNVSLSSPGALEPEMLSERALARRARVAAIEKEAAKVVKHSKVI